MSSPTTARLVFGREPAVWSSLVMAVVALLVAFGVDVSTETQGLIQAAVNAVLGLVVAALVHENVLPAVIAVIGAVLPLVVAFGFDITEAQQGAILAVAPIVLGILFTRPQVTPKAPVAG